MLISLNLYQLNRNQIKNSALTLSKKNKKTIEQSKMNNKLSDDFYKCKNQYEKIKEKISKNIFVLKNDFFLLILIFHSNCL